MKPKYTKRTKPATLVRDMQALLDDPTYATRRWVRNGKTQAMVTRLKNGTGNIDHAREKVITRLNNVTAFTASRG